MILWISNLIRGKSAEEQEAENQFRIKQNQKKVRDYISKCHERSKIYLTRAKKAYNLGSVPQGDRYVATQLTFSKQAEKWDRFLLSIEDNVDRVNAVNDFANLVKDLSSHSATIAKGVSLKGMESMIVGFEKNRVVVNQAEAKMSHMLNNLSVDFDTQMPEQNFEELPEDLKADVAKIRETLMDEIRVEQKTAPRFGREVKGNGQSAVNQETEKRVNDQLDRLKHQSKKRFSRK